MSQLVFTSRCVSHDYQTTAVGPVSVEFPLPLGEGWGEKAAYLTPANKHVGTSEKLGLISPPVETVFVDLSLAFKDLQ
ncbi:7112_t:CDS:2 [Paraglomus brasilianum]|uniref:7112_t:CDS:1 n=1 Tax=Paraglomus brasilianum TaxID=144538 RepID=A0A9N9C791_9GLOM|nr:7112_t:CDS:2 [Paraglomus brasilianum]